MKHRKLNKRKIISVLRENKQLMSEMDSGDEYNYFMSKKRLDNETIQWLANEFDINPSTVSAISDVVGYSPSDVYDELSRISDVKGYGWDQVTNDDDDDYWDAPIISTDIVYELGTTKDMQQLGFSNNNISNIQHGLYSSSSSSIFEIHRYPNISNKWFIDSYNYTYYNNDDYINWLGDSVTTIPTEKNIRREAKQDQSSLLKFLIFNFNLNKQDAKNIVNNQVRLITQKYKNDMDDRPTLISVKKTKL